MRRDVAAVPLKRMVLASLISGLAMLPGGVTAQETPEGPLSDRPERIPLEREGTAGLFDLHAFFAWLAPVSDLTDDPESFATIVNPTVSFGIDGNYWIPNTQFGIGLHVVGNQEGRLQGPAL